MEETQSSEYQQAIDEFLAVSGQLLGLGTPSWIERDLSFPQLKALFVLRYRGPISVGQLAKLLRIGAPTASHLVERLVQAGFAERIESAEDRRIVEVRATPEGIAFTEQLVGLRDAPVARMIAKMAPEDVAALTQGLLALHKIIGAELLEKRGCPLEIDERG